jgi:hypothetical protein
MRGASAHEARRLAWRAWLRIYFPLAICKSQEFERYLRKWAKEDGRLTEMYRPKTATASQSTIAPSPPPYSLLLQECVPAPR